MGYIYDLGVVIVALPLVLLSILGLASLVGKPLSEITTGRLVQVVCSAGLLASLVMLGWMLATRHYFVAVVLGNWVEIHDFHFAFKFEFDRLSVPFVILSYLLCGTIGGFANRYLHREPGYNRFFVLYAFFLLGMVTTSLAGTIETLFAGWELVGISSALLIAFFQERLSPVRNGLRVWVVYRLSDAALLIAAVILHHLHKGDFADLMGTGDWPNGRPLISQIESYEVGFLILLAAAGKSALVPFSGWLPRAMEGPTPSSAIFYGALSVHLGAFLLLRVSPLIDQLWPLRVAVIVIGLLTALFAALAGRVQTDIKSALSFAAMTQVGIIVVEIGCGFHYLALAHIMGHACLRTLQFLRAGSLLQDYRMLENAIGRSLVMGEKRDGGWLPARFHTWFYRFGLERGYLDAILADYIARPIVLVFQCCDAWERRWTDFLAGGTSRESDRLTPSNTSTLEDLT